MPVLMQRIMVVVCSAAFHLWGNSLIGWMKDISHQSIQFLSFHSLSVHVTIPRRLFSGLENISDPEYLSGKGEHHIHSRWNESNLANIVLTVHPKMEKGSESSALVLKEVILKGVSLSCKSWCEVIIDEFQELSEQTYLKWKGHVINV